MALKCLAIGVSDAPPLDFLPGAANGARAIGAWAEAAGYETRVLTDERAPIGIETIATALVGDPASGAQGLLRPGETVERLLLYFAGHGLARDGGEDLWLLSEWFTRQRAVAVSGLRRKLQRYAIGQVTIIADACRSLAVDADSADLTPDSVLGRGPYDASMPMSDVLRASSKYRAAYMVPGDTPEDDRCIFTGVLEEALWGAHPAAFIRRADGPRLTSGSLARFLFTAVPERAQSYRVDLNPDIQPGFIEPDDVYRADLPATPPALRPWPAAEAVGAMGPGTARPVSGRRGWSTAAAAMIEFAHQQAARDTRHMQSIEQDYRERTRVSIEPAAKPVDTIKVDREDIAHKADVTGKRFARLRKAYDDEDRPTHFETGVGFAVSGARAVRAVLCPNAVATDERDGTWWRIAPPDAPSPAWGGDGRLACPLPLLVELDDGRWATGAAIPGFVATFTVAERGVESLIYRRTGREQAPDGEAAVAALRAGMLAGTATGPKAIDFAARLRANSDADPMLGVLAAYLYDSLGDIASIRQIAYFFATTGQAIPFDIAMLAELASRADNGVVTVDIPPIAAREPRSEDERAAEWTFAATPGASGVVAGRVPWMRQGWTLIEPDEDPSALVDPRLAALRPHLGRAPFATLDAAGGAALCDLLFG